MSEDATITDAPVENLERSITRLADVIGGLSPARWGKHNEIDRVGFELPRMPKMNVHTLSALLQLPEANEVITAKCNHCDTAIQCRRVVAPFVACNDCIKKAKDAVALERNKHHWERVCPERYRKTDVNYAGTKKLDPKHADFPLPIWNSLKAEYARDPKQCYFFIGPSGNAKTRTAMLLLYRAMVRRDVYIDVIWPEELSKLNQKSFDNAETYFDRMAKVGLLLLDDSLLTACREPKLMEALKQLVDVRMRHERPFIVTSQIGSEEELKEGKEYGEAKAADLERIRALLRRLREVCKVVSFAKAEPKEGESKF